MMVDIWCGTCKRRYGFSGEPIDCPPCPKCGATPDRRRLANDQVQVDEFRSWFAERKARKALTSPSRMRVAAGLSLRQAAKVLGVEPRHLADVENGRAEAGPELATKMAACYGVAEEG